MDLTSARAIWAPLSALVDALAVLRLSATGETAAATAVRLVCASPAAEVLYMLLRAGLARPLLHVPDQHTTPKRRRRGGEGAEQAPRVVHRCTGAVPEHVLSEVRAAPSLAHTAQR